MSKVEASKLSPEQVKELVEISQEQLQPKTDYWLFHDYYGHGGTRVRLVRREPAKDYGLGRGQVAFVRDDDGDEFLISPKGVIGAKAPKMEQSLNPPKRQKGP